MSETAETMKPREILSLIEQGKEISIPVSYYEIFAQAILTMDVDFALKFAAENGVLTISKVDPNFGSRNLN